MSEHDTKPPSPNTTKNAGPNQAPLPKGAGDKLSPYATPKPKPTRKVDRAEAEPVLVAAADIVQNARDTYVAQAPERFQLGLRGLLIAVNGKKDGLQLSASNRLLWLDGALNTLEPAIAVYRQDAKGRDWLARQFDPGVTAVRNSSRFSRGMERVDNAIEIGGKVVEIGTDDPRRQGAVLHAQMHKVVGTMALVNEQVIRLGHIEIHHEAHELMKGHSHGKALGPGSLVQLQSTLWALDAYLVLSDEKFREHLTHIEGVANGIATYSELVKVVTELVGSATVMTAAYAAIIAKRAGNAALAATATGVARTAGLKFANVIAVIEIVHGIAVLCDSHASRQQKMDAAVHVTAGGVWLAASTAGKVVLGAGLSTAILLGYAQLKYAAYLWEQGAVGINTGLLRLAFETLQRDATSIALSASKLAKVGLLIGEEKSPEKLDDLQRVKPVLVQRLGEDVDYLINDLQPRGFESGIARHPGAYEILREVFAPLQAHRGARDEAGVTAAAKVALERAAWAFAHAGNLAIASAKGQKLAGLENDLEQHRRAEEEKKKK